MSDAPAPIHIHAESLEGRRSVELVRDEDVLSLDLQHALEQVGTGIAVIAAVALVFSHVSRATRAVRAAGAAAAQKGGLSP